MEEKILTKLCSFYVSDWHLITMLLPYINKAINERIEIATILENDIKTNVETLVEKLNLKNREKILSINWNKNKGNKFLKDLQTKENNKILIIINGNKEFIKESNRKLNEYLNKKIEKYKQIKIVDCYEIVEFNGSIVEILDTHDKMLNTSGEKEITDVFEDYIKNEKIS